jgi:hypothetical protein
VCFEAFYDEDRRMRVVGDKGGALTADEARLLPYSTAAEREVRYHQCSLLGIRDEHRYDGDEEDWGESVLGDLPLRRPRAVRQLDPARVPTPDPTLDDPIDWGEPVPADLLPRLPPRENPTAPSSGLMTSRVGVLPAAEGRPPMPPIRPRSPPATGRDT